jgi:hypothetical protein
MPFGVQPNEMSAVLAVLAPDARFDAEQVRIRAIDAFSQRDTYLGDYYFAGITDRKQVLARLVAGTTLEIPGLFRHAVDPATHEQMRMSVVVGFNFLKTFVHPVDAVPAVDHSSILLEKVRKTYCCGSGGRN